MIAPIPIKMVNNNNIANKLPTKSNGYPMIKYQIKYNILQNIQQHLFS